MDGISTALVASFTEVATELTGIISKTLPVALPVIGGMIVVTIGIKVFKKITSKA